MYRLQTLGSPEFSGPSSTVKLRLREAALLARLSENAPHKLPRVALTQLLWPGVPVDRGLRSLSQLLYQIRCRIPDVPIVCDARSIGLEQTICDLGELRNAARQALHIRVVDLYGGRFLGSDESPSRDLDEWREQVDREVAVAVGEALAQCIAVAESPPDLHCVMESAGRLVRSPYATPADYCLCAIAYIRSGRQRQAEQLYMQMKETFSDVAALPTLGNLIATAKSPGYDERLDDRVVRFAGREREVNLLVDAWRKSVAGEGQVVTILGEPGIGKTRLAEQLLRRAALGGSQVWITRCHAGTRRVRFSAIADLLRENVRNLAVLPSEFSEIVSFLTQPWAGRQPNNRFPADEWHFRMLETLTRLINDVSDVRPLAILVDDVQWADDFTAQLLTLWALRIPTWRVLLLMTLRTEDVEPTPDWVIYELATTSNLTLGQLSIESAGEIVDAYEAQANIRLTPSRRSQILWQSAGRPFLLLEGLLAASRQEGAENEAVFLPESAEALLQRRFRGLSDHSTWLSGILAALGSAAEPKVLVRLAGLSASETAAALESLSSRGILDLKLGKLDYPHDLMREAAYRLLSPATRMLIHQRIADDMARHGGDEGVLAQHYAKSADRLKAGRPALTAAERAGKHCLYSDCEFYYRLAINSGFPREQQKAVRGLARLLIQTGRTSEIEPFISLLGEQRESQESSLLIRLFTLEKTLASDTVVSSDVVHKARQIIGMSSEVESADLGLALGMLFDIGHDAGIAEFGSEITRAFAHCSTSRHRDDFFLQIEALTAVFESSTVGWEIALRRLQFVESISTTASTPLTQSLALFSKGTLLLLGGNLLEAKQSLGRAMELAQSSGDHRRLSATYMNSAVTLIELGEYRAARTMLDAVLASPNRAHRLRALTNLAILHYETGDDALTLNTVQAILTANVSYGSAKYSAIAPALAGLVYLRNHDLEQARGRLAWLQSNSKETDYTYGDASYTVSFVARMLAVEGSVSEALKLLDEATVKSLPRDRMCALRLTCTQAEILLGYDRDRAYAMAKALLRDALSMHAAPTAARAKAIVSAARI